MTRRVESVLWVLAALTSGCGRVEATQTATQASGQPCPDWGCGSNSATVDGNLFFHDLSTCGAANSAGVRLLVAMKRIGSVMQQFPVSVEGDQLVGKLGVTLGTLQGQDLVGTKLMLQTPGGVVLVTIAHIGSTDYWVSPGRPVPTYVLTWDHDASTTSTVCGTQNVTLPADWVARSGTDATAAILFAGDRYDAAQKTVQAGQVASSASTCWFNIACAGSAAAKMHLLRHTTAGGDATHTTTQPQRQAMLKMITDDICGTGESFTVAGENVYYEDMRRWHPMPGAPESIEALWDDRGATCLDAPRRQREDPSVTERIQSACAAAHHDLPTCPISTSNYNTWPERAQTEDLGYGLSANPTDGTP